MKEIQEDLYSKDDPNIEAIAEILEDFELFAKYFLYIRDKKGEIVHFVMNPTQKIVYEKYKWAKEHHKLPRFIILKARQKGISTLWQAIIYWEILRKKNRKAVTIGHVLEASDNLFNMSKRYYKYMPKGIKLDGRDYILKPEVTASNKKELILSHESENRILTAGNDEDVGRSATIQYLHCTEVAFWPDAKGTLTGLLQCVPEIEDSLVVLETTANGVGGEYYNRWQSAMLNETTEEGEDYIPIFISWLVDDEYTRQFTSATEKNLFIQTMTPKEKLLMEKGATLEHLKFRRYKVKASFGGDEDMFAQEYPSDPVEAFVVSGRPVFDKMTVQHNYNTARKPLKTGNLEYIYSDKGEVKGVEFFEMQGGFVSIWTDFEVYEGDTHRFAAGADVAEGLEQHDFSEIRVLDRRDMKVCMTWHGHLDPDQFGEEIYKLHLYLKGQCTFNPEANNHGLTTITTAFKLGVPMYYRQDYGKGTPTTSTLIGSKTSNNQAKKFYIDHLNEWIRDHTFEDYDREFWGQCMTFVRSGNQMCAQGKDKDEGVKCYDDMVMAAAMMIICALWLPLYHKHQAEEVVARSYIRNMRRRRGRGPTRY